MALPPSAMDAVKQAEMRAASEIEKKIDTLIAASWHPDDKEHFYDVPSQRIGEELARRYTDAGWLCAVQRAGPTGGDQLVFRVPEK